MYKNHPSFKEPESEKVKIWRYLDFTKFVSVVDKNQLFFARSDRLGDPFEGSYPTKNVEQRKLNHTKFLKSLPPPIKIIFEGRPRAISEFRKNIRKFIFISSVKAGTSFHDKKDSVRNNIGKTGSVYGESKREAELGLLDIGRKSHMKVTILRPALVYGPGQKGNLALMLKGVKKGWFPPLPKTNNKRSMVHIDNLVNAIFFVSESNCVDGEVFIVADNRPYSSYEIYNVMRHITGKKVLKWGMPKFLFDMAALISPGIRHKLNKLLASEYYPSNKLDSLGFKYKKTLKDMNETSF